MSEKFAFKVGGELIQAKDWVADDYRDYDRVGTTGAIKNGTRNTDPNYDGINVYGDETTIDIQFKCFESACTAGAFLCTLC